jgi:spermidine synthase
MHRTIVWEGDTLSGHFQVVDGSYDGRPARVLYSGGGRAAQSGVALDAEPDLLFDYNQRLLELATNLAPRTVLLIGGGVGTLSTALLRALPDVRITMVEPDATLIRLGHQYFDLPVDDRLTIYVTDGRSYLREHSTHYDMVLLDAFEHTTIPRDLKTLEAFEAYRRHLRSPGVLAANLISGYYGANPHVLDTLYAAALQTFDSVDVFRAGAGYSLWLPQNFVLAAQAGSDWPLRDYLRHDAVKPPEIGPERALRD